MSDDPQMLDSDFRELHALMYAAVAERDAELWEIKRELAAWKKWASIPRLRNLGPSEMTTQELISWWQERPSDD